MNFSELYRNRKHKDIIREHTLMVSDHDEPCMECGEPTRFIDYCGECRLCSTECQDRFWQRVNISCGDFHDKINLRDAAVAVENYIDNPSMETLRELGKKLYESYFLNAKKASEDGKSLRDSPSFVSRAVSCTATMLPMKKKEFGGYAHKMINEIVKDANPESQKYYNVGAKLVEMYAQLLVVAHMEFGNGQPMWSVLRYFGEED